MDDPLDDIWDEPVNIIYRIPVDRYKAPLQSALLPSVIGMASIRLAQAYWRQRTLEASFLLALAAIATGLIFALVR